MKETTQKKDIEHFIVMGDSLSDQGSMYYRKLFGVIPMRYLAGLQGKSPRGAFTNGYAWSTIFITGCINQLAIKDIKKELENDHVGSDSDDMADAVITRDNRIQKPLENHKEIIGHTAITNGSDKDFFTDYAEGGATAYDYYHHPWSVFPKSISAFFTRLIVSNLNTQRKAIQKHDEQRMTLDPEKKKVLIIDWSGANDLITVNEKPKKDAMEKAVAARLENIEKLIEQGYENFAIFNLPNLSLTPRYHRLSDEKKKNAYKISSDFNEKLATECKKLQENHATCCINTIDVNKVFEEIYKNPENYSFDTNKKNEPYTESHNFKTDKKNKTSKSKGYMFWDDVHPTSDMHQQLVEKLKEKILEGYTLVKPGENKEEGLYREFKNEYDRQFNFDRYQLLGIFSHRNLTYRKENPNEAIQDIVNYAKSHPTSRTHEVLVKLKWIDGKNEIINEKVKVIVGDQTAKNTPVSRIA